MKLLLPVWALLLGVSTVRSQNQAYQITDLGKGLGPRSYAQGVNNHGQVVGYSVTPFGARAFLYKDASFIDLGPLGGKSNYALSINDSAQIVGFSETSTGIHAFLVQGGMITNLA